MVAARVVGLAALLGACRAPGRPPRAEAASSFAPVPNVVLIDQDGRERRFYDDLVRGRCVAIQFFFTECDGICPVSTGRLLAMQAELGPRLGRDVWFLSVTLDPERDTPERLAEHARAIGAGAGWTFLTGAGPDIEALRRRLGVFDLDPALDADRSQHAGVLVLGNDRRQRWSMKPATLPARSLTQSLLRLVD